MAMGPLAPNYLALGGKERLLRSGGRKLLEAKLPGVEGTEPPSLPRSFCPGSGLPDLDGGRGGGAAPSVAHRGRSRRQARPALPARARPPAPPAGSPPITAALAALALAHRSAPPSAGAQTAKLSKSCGRGTSERSWARGGAGTPRPQGTPAAAGPSPAPHPCSRSPPPVGDRRPFLPRRGRPRVSLYSLQSFSIPASESTPGSWGWVGSRKFGTKGTVRLHRPLRGVCPAAGLGEPEPGSEKEAPLRGCSGSCRAEGPRVPCPLPLCPWTPPLASLAHSNPRSRLSAPSPACLLLSPPAPRGQASGICRTAVVGGEGQGACARLGVQTRRTLEVRVRGAVWDTTGRGKEEMEMSLQIS